MVKITPTKPYLSYKVWGDEQLGHIKGLPSKDEKGLPLGESWEIARSEAGSSLIEGELPSARLSFILKLLATSSPLSVQVHPDDNYALKRHGSKGKTECWVVLDAKDSAPIYLGLKEDVTPQLFEQSLKEEKSIIDLMNVYYPEKGDFFVVPAGTLHAIGEGLFIAEVQQSSGHTYRVWDWNRKKSEKEERPLHHEDALKVISYGKDQKYSYFESRKERRPRRLFEHADFALEQIRLKGGETTEVSLTGKRPGGLVVLEGEALCRGEKIKAFQTYYMESDERATIQVSSANGAWFLWVS